MKAKNPTRYVSQTDQQRILDAISKAEHTTSGEVRVHIEGRCEDENPLDRAAWLFGQLKMEQTEQRNGVLIYLAVTDRKLAIVGDCGINQRVAPDYWEQTKDQMIALLKQARLVEALECGILSVGEQLKTLFPYQDNDVNELPDAISFGD